MTAAVPVAGNQDGSYLTAFSSNGFQSAPIPQIADALPRFRPARPTYVLSCRAYTSRRADRLQVVICFDL